MSGTSGGGSGTGSPGYPVYPAGWEQTLTLLYYAWQQANAQQRFNAAILNPNFAMYSGVHVVVEPDAVQAMSVPQLQFLFANLPRGRKYVFYVNMPLSSLSQPQSNYPFHIRVMNVQYGGRNINTMLVPVMSIPNQPAVTTYVVARYYDIETLFAAANAAGASSGTSFELIALSLGVTSEVGYDNEMTIPSDAGNGSNIPPETPAQAVANWASFGVTSQNLTTVLCAHALAVARGPGAGKFLSCDFLSPNTDPISHEVDTGNFYMRNARAINDTLTAGTGQVLSVMDATLASLPERTTLVAAADYTGSFICQIPSPVQSSVPALLNYAVSRNALWLDFPLTFMDAAAALGWNGSRFAARPPASSIYVTS